MPAENIRDSGRVQRLISLAYFLSTRSEVHIDELAERVGVSRETIEQDLNVLMYCGLPPYSPDQLFDIIIEDDFVSMYFNSVFVTPMRLTEEEKAHVVVALARLRALSADTHEHVMVDAITEKIDGAHSHVIDVQISQSPFDDLLHTSLEDHVPIEITYMSLSSASLAQRVIEVHGIYTTASITYVFAYCHDAQDFRVFRTDRILDAQVREDIKPLSRDNEAKTTDAYESVEESSLYIEHKEQFVDLHIDSRASWILDSYPHEVLDEEKNIYRFYTPSPFFAARMLLANIGFVSYISGTIDRETILNSLETMRDRMKLTAKG